MEKLKQDLEKYVRDAELQLNTYRTYKELFNARMLSIPKQRYCTFEEVIDSVVMPFPYLVKYFNFHASKYGEQTVSNLYDALYEVERSHKILKEIKSDCTITCYTHKVVIKDLTDKELKDLGIYDIIKHNHRSVSLKLIQPLEGGTFGKQNSFLLDENLLLGLKKYIQQLIY